MRVPGVLTACSGLEGNGRHTAVRPRRPIRGVVAAVATSMATAAGGGGVLGGDDDDGDEAGGGGPEGGGERHAGLTYLYPNGELNSAAGAPAQPAADCWALSSSNSYREDRHKRHASRHADREVSVDFHPAWPDGKQYGSAPDGVWRSLVRSVEENGGNVGT